MNIVLIAIDSLRADHLRCYGYHRDTSPNLDALAREGALLTGMYAPAIPTQPSFTTIYTGQYSLTHGIVSHGGDDTLRRDSPFFPEDLQRAGLTTCAIDNLYAMRPWFARGYEFYIDPSHRAKMRLSVTCEGINRRAIPWLRAHAGAPFLLFVHYWDTHTPYRPPARLRHRYYNGDPTRPEFDTLDPMRTAPLGDVWVKQWLGPLSRKLWHGREIRDAEYVVALYDACIRYIDEAVGALLSALEEAKAAADTLVVVIADHGEMMYRHGIFFDHHGLYDANIRVPFIVRWPGRVAPGQRLGGGFELVDLAPTLLEAVGVPIPPVMEGRSLAPLITDGPEPAVPVPRRIVSQECTWQAKWCLVHERSAAGGARKVIVAREPDLYGRPMRELYDLDADPDELHDLAQERPAEADELQSELEQWIARMLEKNHLDHDPLTTHGTTLGKRWAQGRY
jgi:arylsulfatase A-like enzyme